MKKVVCALVLCVALAGLAAGLYVVFKPEGERGTAGTGSQLIDGSFLPLTKAKMTLVAHAIRRNQEIYDFGFFPEGVNVHDFHNHTDRMYTEEQDNYCMATWMGTDKSLLDWGQNFNSDQKLIGDDCAVHTGFYQAYSGSGSGENEEFVPILTEFVESCSASGKQIVFTGHSQGGAAAGIAHIIFNRFSPITIGFGSAPFHEEKSLCNNVIPKGDLLRFINSENRNDMPFGQRIAYDPIPNLNLVQAWSLVGFHAGGYVVLPPGDQDGDLINPMQQSVAYFSPDFPDMNIGLKSMDIKDGSGTTGSSHTTSGYRDKIDILLASLGEGEDMNVNGWIDGTRCLVDGECSMFNTVNVGGCVDAVCTGGATGDSCKDDDQCKSGRCEFDGSILDSIVNFLGGTGKCSD